MKNLTRFAFALALLGPAWSARAGILELRNGQTMSGKYAGGAADMIYYRTDMGQMMIDVSKVVAPTMVVPAPAAAVPAPAPVSAAPAVAELSKIGDEKLALIVKFANQFPTMTDQDAAAVAEASLETEERRFDLKRTYFKKFVEIVPARKATRYFQIENQFNLLLDLQVAASLPLIK